MGDKNQGTPDPGAPVPRDHIDPELVNLRVRGMRLGPLLGVSVLVFCAYMLISLRSDMRFSLAGDQPTAVAGVEELLASADSYENQYVDLPAPADRSFAAHVSKGQTPAGGHIASPALGGRDRLWLLVSADPWSEQEVTDPERGERLAGRLRAIDRLPFAEALRDHVREQGPTPRSVSPAGVQNALRDRANSIAGPNGDALSVEAATPVSIERAVPGRGELVVTTTSALPDEAAWVRELSAAGIIPADATSYRQSGRSFWFRIQVPDGLDRLESQLVEANLFAAHGIEQLETMSATWGELQLADGTAALSVAGQSIGWSEIRSISVAVPHTVPDDALVLIAGQRPGDYWYLLPIYAALGVVALLFGWGLLASLRGAAPRPQG